MSNLNESGAQSIKREKDGPGVAEAIRAQHDLEVAMAMAHIAIDATDVQPELTNDMMRAANFHDAPPAIHVQPLPDKPVDGNLTATTQDVLALLNEAAAAPSDAGAKARDALFAFQLLQKENRRKRIKFWTGWLVFLMLVAGAAFGTWYVLPNYVVSGRYSVVAECKVPFGTGELTGKREYSYAYKSLFGYHLVDEATKLEKTTLDITGNKLTILGQHGDKWWRQNIETGERGVAILKPAEMYWFVSDKNTALVPASGFCK